MVFSKNELIERIKSDTNNCVENYYKIANNIYLQFDKKSNLHCITTDRVGLIIRVDVSSDVVVISNYELKNRYLNEKENK
jgi:hypothetical protein